MAITTGITTADRPETVCGRQCAVMIRTILKVGVAAAMLSLMPAAFAQTNAPAAPQTAAPAVQAQTSPAAQAQTAPAAQTPAAAPAADAADTSKAAKPVSLQVPSEMSPWSMFKSA